jgi:hypothetical protein
MTNGAFSRQSFEILVGLIEHALPFKKNSEMRGIILEVQTDCPGKMGAVPVVPYTLLLTLASSSLQKLETS